MKVSKKTQDQIKALTKSVEAKYDKYREESALLDEIVSPYLKKAVKTKDENLINQLLNLTEPNKTSGGYIGRYYIFLASSEIDAELKKEKKKK